MISKRINQFVLIFLSIVFIAGVGIAFTLNNDFGKLEVKVVTIPNGDHYISGLLYSPHTINLNKNFPAVVLVHGISSAKESMSGIALELARSGFVALSIDVVGHGDSGGALGVTTDPSLGTLAAVMYLEDLPYVNASSIGLVGHSLGAGAVRAVTALRYEIKAIVLIAGGLGDMVVDQVVYGKMNSTFPKNLLVAIGKQDVLFDLAQVKGKWLPPVFGTSHEVVPNHLYGDFTTNTARKLIVPTTTHLLEPLDPTIVSETVVWFNKALKSDKDDQTKPLEDGLTYVYREVAMLLSIFALIVLVFPISLYMLPQTISNEYNEKNKVELVFISDWKIMLIWGTVSITLSLPVFFIGLAVPFPPVLFGSSIAWWLLIVAVAGLLIVLLILPKFLRVKIRMRALISDSFTWRGVSAVVILFVLLYVVIYIIDALLGMKLCIFVPIFRALYSVRRFTVFLMFIPFFLIFFYVEGIYLHILRKGFCKIDLFSEVLRSVGRIVGIKIAPYVAIMSLNYVPMFLLEIKPLPTFIGFLMEFFPLITVQFVISTICSWWFHRVTSSVGLGAIFNALMFAWVSAGTFPFGTFH